MDSREADRIPLATVLNFRDVGLTINRHIGQEVLQPRTLYRGARPDEASFEDRRRLKDEFGVKTIIDLRTHTEHVQQAQKHKAAHLNQKDHEGVKIAGLEYKEINFNGWSYSMTLMSKLSWWDFGRLLYLMAMGYRVEAIRVLGENVLQTRGLIGLATDSLDSCTAEVLEVFSVLADPTNYPVMVHCTQGKDRSGLVVVLALLLVGVPLDAIDHDYMLSGEELIPEREERLQEIHSIGLGDQFADCDPRFVHSVKTHIDEKYGSIEKYLQQCRVTEQMQDCVRQILRADRWT